ncbi:vWA domain-containing protein [Methylotenera sp.]|uniref:vWA domain-containing protein n=1 Tax=Methylotenera sp. TaxID=2051956 RepID=UPI002723E262|nr:vWA domain-containing protein [Methylotenera sp.]MDO9205741.1 vWA domain-containing protein [Methylotenera sp.]MDP1522938.1 vWA domain-containing protein [Methylotenera sp.]MDP2229431.1 vWA domain-containing protein [Methylotenera sp.]MDP3142208.1 vWA domain-containing protein [Methylotenera sp.]MDP3306622.1 vWA domain-containing protein [Methylotenera sp.]
MNHITKLKVKLQENYETVLYLCAAAFLLLALIKPEIQLKQEVHNYLLIADVSQSMNAEDMKVNNLPVSRLVYTQYLMREVVKTSPCGTYVSVGAFSAENVALLFMPLEVCANLDIINDTIDHLEWRMSWSGNSRITFGVKAAEATFDYLNIPAQMLFFTDGDEAPKANSINKLDLSGVRIGKNVIFVGVGGHEPSPIKRFNANNEFVGYWGTDAAADTGAVGANYADASKDDPDPVVAYSEFDRYLSKQEADYLKGLATDIKGQYVEGLDAPAFYQFVQSQAPAAKFITAYSLRWLYLVLAALAVLATYLPDLLYRLKHKKA